MVKTNHGLVDWSWYGKCRTCGAEPREKCIDTRYRTLKYSTVPHKGRVKREDLI